MAHITYQNWMTDGPYIGDTAIKNDHRRVATRRYYDKAYHEAERNKLWMRTWQIAGRADELATPGEWLEYRLFDQSWIIVRGNDDVVRGFVNACRHRGNRLCKGKGKSGRFLCNYHNWTFNLDGTLIGVARPDYQGTLEAFVGNRDELGLIEVPVECFAGFIFINPDPAAPPLKEFLGDAYHALAAYPLEHMVPVGINVRERVECNWKVIMDAFGEGYHVQGVHAELVGVVDLRKERFMAFRDHGVSTTPFGRPQFEDLEDGEAIEELLRIPTSHFAGFSDVIPLFANTVKTYLDREGTYQLPPGVTPRSLFQQAVRETLTGYGLNVENLNDSQLIDYHFWLLFPNVFLQLSASDATLIIAEPDPEGDPNRCFWRVMTLRTLPEGSESTMRTAFQEIPENLHYPYFLALEQDYIQMARQQEGLRNTTLKELVLTRQEPRVAHFHKALDQWMAS